MLNKKIYVYDTTLRDGAQGEGISFTVLDKLKILKKLDELGVDYIEAGNPGSNPKDMEFFNSIKNIKLVNAKIVAFGSTRRANTKVEEDTNITAILESSVPVAAIFGKTWDFHVTDIIKTTLKENLNMIKDTIKYLKKNGKEVIFDAEHFFDGYANNPKYAMEALKTAVEAGADSLVLCDTNGGAFPSTIYKIVEEVKNIFNIPIGIHCHNDGGMAVANSIMSVEASVTQIQGTINGYGERCGNANLCSIIPNLQIKRGMSLLPKNKMLELTTVARYVSELANKGYDEQQPYVGNNAFAHKGGMHIDAIIKNPTSFEHINPEIVGNERRVLMSEVSGRSTILNRLQVIDSTLTKDSHEAQKIINKLKKLEHEGYQFEGAEGSFELMVKRVLGKDKTYFNVLDYFIKSEMSTNPEISASAIIKVEVGGREEITAAQGDGPVNALDKALRKVLCIFYPQLKKMRLADFKVRVIDTADATAAKVRVMIESTDGESVWGTVGVSTNVIEASWFALTDSIEYFLENNNTDKSLEEDIEI